MMSQQKSENPLSSAFVLGVLGSGQLARMTALAAADLGIQTHVYCADSGPSPAEDVAAKTTKGSFSDLDRLLTFCRECDVITLENEFIDPAVLEAIDQYFPQKLFPSAATFKKIGDKISEKQSFEKAGLKVVPYQVVHSPEDVSRFASHHGYPVVLKSSKGGYDGYGNATIKSAADLESQFAKVKGEKLVEAFIPYDKELAVMVARNQKGEMVVYPVAHTIQENHICHFVSVPAEISPELHHSIQATAQKAMTAIDAVGIFAFEFFLTKEGTLYLNESAPRPHNSGHYSLEGCMTSQFHNHVRAVCQLPLGKTELRAPQVAMLNLLGTHNGEAALSNPQDFLALEDGHLHLYGKKQSRVGRKMGHFTLLGKDKHSMLECLEQLKRTYSL